MTVHYSLIQGFFWMAYCAGTGFSSTYLLSIGFENAQIGILIALSGLAAAALQPSLAGLIDRSGRRLLKPVIFAAAGMSAGLSLLQLLVSSEFQELCGFCFVGNLAMLQLLIPLINSLSICGRSREGINFGFARAVGSLCYAGVSYLLGILISEYGMAVLSQMRIFSFAALLLTLAIFPVRLTGQRTADRGRDEKKKNGFFSRYPGFTVVMAGCFLLYLCHSFLTYYNYQIVLTRGGDERSYGVVIALAAALELPVMFGFARMLKKRPAAFWFGLAGFGYILKALTALLSGSMTAYYFVQIFQMMAWALISVASVSFVKEMTEAEDSTRGQACITMAYTTAMAAGSLGGGFLLQLLDVNIMLFLAVLSAAAGTGILLKGIQKTGKRLSSI